MLNKMLLVFIFGALTLTTAAQDKEIKKCKPAENDGKYKSVSVTRVLDEKGTIYSRIVVEPKNFTSEYLRQVARRFKSEYCNEKHLLVVIFDDLKLALDTDIAESLSSTEIFNKMRGIYSFDQTTGKEGFEFSTKLGNPTTEVQVDLSSNQ